MLVEAIRKGDGATSLNLARADGNNEANWRDIPGPKEMEKALEEIVLSGYRDMFKAKTLEEAFLAFGSFRILCAHREGPYGVYAVNQMVEKILSDKGLIQGGVWFKGRPIMTVSNDYDLRLFNGDIGLSWVDEENSPGDMALYFPSEDGNEMRRIEPGRLPGHETVFAMTLHKSQGSEFDRVLILLGNERSRVMTRELVYTGISRAKKSVEIWSDEDTFRDTVAEPAKHGGCGLLSKIIG